MTEEIEVYNMAYRPFYIHAEKDIGTGAIRIYVDERPSDDMPMDIIYPKQVSGVNLWKKGDIGKREPKMLKERT